MKSRRQLGYADRVLKVNHAGEHGAVNIYRGQRLVCFQRGVRRCRSYGLCGLGGFVLGVLTGICGRASIAAVTVAVERVVLRHLEEQLRTLAHEPAAVASIIEDERAHHDRAAQEPRQGIFWPRLLRPAVSAATELVIWTGMRI